MEDLQDEGSTQNMTVDEDKVYAYMETSENLHEKIHQVGKTKDTPHSNTHQDGQTDETSNEKIHQVGKTKDTPHSNTHQDGQTDETSNEKIHQVGKTKDTPHSNTHQDGQTDETSNEKIHQVGKTKDTPHSNTHQDGQTDETSNEKIHQVGKTKDTPHSNTHQDGQTDETSNEKIHQVGKTKDTPHSNTHQDGQTDETSNEKIHQVGKTKDTPHSNTHQDGQTDETSNEKIHQVGKTKDTPHSNTHQDGQTDETSNEKIHQVGKTKDTPHSNTHQDGLTDETPNEKRHQGERTNKISYVQRHQEDNANETSHGSGYSNIKLMSDEQIEELYKNFAVTFAISLMFNMDIHKSRNNKVVNSQTLTTHILRKNFRMGDLISTDFGIDSNNNTIKLMKQLKSWFKNCDPRGNIKKELKKLLSSTINEVERSGYFHDKENGTRNHMIMSKRSFPRLNDFLFHPVFKMEPRTYIVNVVIEMVNDVPWFWFKSEIWRLLSFDNCFVRNCIEKSVILLAKNGFLYNGSGSDDFVICYFCKGTKEGWRAGDDIVEIHRGLNPNCPMVTGDRCNNDPFVPNPNVSFDLIRHHSGLQGADSAVCQSSGTEAENTTASATSISRFHDSSVVNSTATGRNCHTPAVSRRHCRTFTASETRCSTANQHITAASNAHANQYPTTLSADPSTTTVSTNRCTTTVSTSQPTTTVSASQPTTTVSASQPTTTVSASQPTTTVSASQPTTTVSASQPTTTVSASQPTTTVSASQPTTTVSANQPTTTVSANKPTTTDLVDQTTNRFRCFAQRLHTFREWRSDHPLKKESLAKAGFFYEGNADNVRCFKCGVEILINWKKEEYAWVEHAPLSPHCPHIQKNVGKNCVDADAYLTQNHAQKMVEMQSNGTESPKYPLGQLNTSDVSQNTPRHQKIESSVLRSRQYEKYARHSLRVASFKDWPADHHLNRDDLADAGFFYKGYKDCARCFQCAGNLRDWEKGDNVWVEHARFYPKCAYLWKRVGQGFIDTVASLSRDHKQISLTMVKKTMQRDGTKFPEFLQKIHSRYRCKICSEREVAVIFRPCQHLVCCEECGLITKNCPECQKVVLNTLRGYMV